MSAPPYVSPRKTKEKHSIIKTMIIKTYGVDGLIEWHINVPAGRVLLNIEFSNGRFSGYCMAPAVYRTADPVVQRAIEHSSHFRSGRIRIVDVKETPAPHDTGKSPVKTEDSAARRIIDVPDWNSARLQLIRMTGVAPDRLQSRGQMQAVAAEYNIDLRMPTRV